MKWLFGILLLFSLALFSFMQWGEKLTTDSQGTQAQPALQADKIILLPPPMVLPAAAASAVANADIASMPVAGQSAVQASCMEWGEFSGDELKRATAALAELNLGNRLTQRQVERISGYWVYMPPRENRAEVDRKIAELRALGINEYFVMQDAGKWHNAISLGIFKTADAAQKFLESIMAQGVKTARTGERLSKLTVTAFLLNSPDADTAAKMGALQNRFTGSTLKTVACAN